MKVATLIWLYSIVTYFPQDVFKVAVRYILSGKAWLNLFEKLTAFTMKKDYRKEEREVSMGTCSKDTSRLVAKRSC
ncbi:unnamed protein product [Brassica rapa subsp. trilocularis]